ncbi:hypothetical protein ACHAXR_002564 [Thalassiosira sp. AJA248-18]
MFMMPPLLLLLLIINSTNVINPAVPHTLAAISCLLRLQHIKYTINHHGFVRCFLLDHIHHDIPLGEEEEQEPTRMPRQNIRFNSWTSQECYDFTSFTKEQLQRIYHLFGLAQLAAQNSGFIRVFDGHEYLRFHPEEIFLFLMTKCKTGDSNKQLCDFLFRGHQSRWSYGWPWILEYLDIRYKNTIGNQKLCSFVDQFPQFYEAIQRRVQQTRTHHFTDHTAEDCTGLNFLPFDIFAFIDCSIDP